MRLRMEKNRSTSGKVRVFSERKFFFNEPAHFKLLLMYALYLLSLCMHITNCNLIFSSRSLSASVKFSLVRCKNFMNEKRNERLVLHETCRAEVGDEVCVSHDLSSFCIDLVLLLFSSFSLF
jgi:hypothetical protein